MDANQSEERAGAAENNRLAGVFRIDMRMRNKRLINAAVTAVLSAYFVGPLYACAWMVMVMAFEGAVQRALAPALERHAATRPGLARALDLGGASLGSSVYMLGWLPAVFSGRPGAEYFAALGLASSMIGSIAYRPKDTLAFVASVGPLGGATAAALLLTNGQAWLLSLVLIAATGRLFAVAWLAYEDRRDLVGRVAAARRARRAADAANEAKSRFLAAMSHELRTPLSAMIGYAEMLEEDLRNDGREDGAVDAARIRRSARNLLSLVNEVLDFSKIEAERVDIVEAPTDVQEIVGEVMETCRHIADANGSVIKFAGGSTLGAVVTDPMKLRQCLLNLVSNACKFTAGGVIEISVAIERETTQEFLRVEVADTGHGIAPEQASRLFQPFVQGDHKTARNQMGTGLGLAITRKLAQLMGGDVSLVSTAGVGSTFTLRINVGREHVHEKGTDADGPLVIVIEDEAAARDLACRTLSRLPMRVACTSDAAGGLALARAEKTALIVLDLRRADKTGLDMLADLRAHSDIGAAPVLAVGAKDECARALALGACVHVLDDEDRSQLLAAVMRHARWPAQGVDAGAGDARRGPVGMSVYGAKSA